MIFYYFTFLFNQEAEQLVSQRSNNPRAMWAQREKEANAPPPARYSSYSLLLIEVHSQRLNMF